MEILFRTKRDLELFSSEEALVRRFGNQQARVIMRRLAELGGARNLALMGCLPPARCHELVGDRAGQFAVAVKDPYRLIFEPAGSSVARQVDGGVDRARVTAIVIVGVINYHG